MRRIAMFGSLVLAGLAAAAQLVAQGAAAAPAPAPAKKAMFWKVSSADNVAWLLGSIHLGSKSMYPLPKEIEDAFERSTALLVEIDINHVDLAEDADAGLSNRVVSAATKRSGIMSARRPANAWRHSARNTGFRRWQCPK